MALLTSGVVLAHADHRAIRSGGECRAGSGAAQVTIEFTEPVEPRLSKIEVLYDDGSMADNNDTTRDPNDPKVLHVSLKDSRAGNVHRLVARVERSGRARHVGIVCVLGGPADRSGES